MRTTNYVYALTAMTSLVAIVATAKLQNNSVRYQPDTQPFFSLGQIDAQTIKYLYGGNSVVGNSAGVELFGGPFVPFPTRAEAMPIVGDDIATMAAFMYGGSTPATDDVSDLTRFLYGGEGQSSTSQKSNDALESINSIMNFQPDEEAFDATNTLAAFLLGGSAQAPRDEITELAQFLYGAGSSVVRTTNFDNSEEGTIKFLLGGEASNAVDETEDIARFLFGGEAASPTAGSDERSVVFNPDASDDNTLAAFLLGGSAQAPRDEITELAQFLYGAGSSVVRTTNFDNSEEGTIKFLLGGEASNAVDETEDIARFLFGGEAASPTAGSDERSVVFNPDASEDAVAETTKYLYGAQGAVNPYEENGKCMSEKCIDYELSQMQADLSITDADLDEGLAWGEDMVQYCHWQSRQEIARSKLAPPPLPQLYSKPPSPSVCKTVMASSRMLVHTASL